MRRRRVIEFPGVFTHLPQLLCSTADSFATNRHEVDGDVVDMEAFALARVCLAENARFACVKYITDGADAIPPRTGRRRWMMPRVPSPPLRFAHTSE